MGARERVREAGCNLFPIGAHGACLLVPLTDEQLFELGLQLEKYHIVALRSDRLAIDEALRQVPRAVRPKLRDDHRANVIERTSFADHAGSAPPSNSNAIEELEMLRPQVREIALLHPRIRELIQQNIGISEPSEVTVSAPCGEGSSVQPENPRHYDWTRV